MSQGALEIYLSGCDGYCGDKCHNKELWNFDLGVDYSKMLDVLEAKLTPPVGDIVKQVWVLGGEPLLQSHAELKELLLFIRNVCDKEIVLFTRFDESSVPQDLYNLCDYIKYGEYKEELSVDDYYQFGIKLATSNQYIIKVSEINENGSRP